MIYFNQLLEIPLFSGILFLIIGAILFIFPAKKPNVLYGYRTTRSMSSLLAWEFSQKYAAIRMIQVGVIFLLFSLLGIWYTFANIGPTVVGSCILISGIVFLIISTELALKTKFPKKK